MTVSMVQHTTPEINMETKHGGLEAIFFLNWVNFRLHDIIQGCRSLQSIPAVQFFTA